MGDGPQKLESHRPERQPFWPADPVSWPAAVGMLVGTVVPVTVTLWDRWAEDVIRVPRSWCQQQWLIPAVRIALVVAVCVAGFGLR